MSQHFEGKYEVELKYRLPCRDTFLAQLRAVNVEVRFEDNLEHDWYYDRPDHSLAPANKHLIIREIQPANILLWIVKGPDADRCEAVNITNVDRARSMLETMGFELALELNKRRSIYFHGEFHLTVDHLDGIGDFAEFAIMIDDESLIDSYHQQLTALAKRFGLTEHHLECHSYRQLQTAKNNGA